MNQNLGRRLLWMAMSCYWFFFFEVNLYSFPARMFLMLERCFQMAMVAMNMAKMSRGLSQVPSANFPCFHDP